MWNDMRMRMVFAYCCCFWLFLFSVTEIVSKLIIYLFLFSIFHAIRFKFKLYSTERNEQAEWMVYTTHSTLLSPIPNLICIINEQWMLLISMAFGKIEFFLPVLLFLFLFTPLVSFLLLAVVCRQWHRLTTCRII